MQPVNKHKLWNLSTVLEIYELIEQGKKQFDTRVPDPSNPEKDYASMLIGDVARIIAVDSINFRPLEDKPKLILEISALDYIRPVEGESWQDLARYMLNHIGLENVFPGYTIEEAIALYKKWPSTCRMQKNGLVAICFKDRLV